ncbi:universal stress protein [Hamadaea sp.]|uniref:universal stress protein n=1 Tax=Hamadaea sp. TaxID=2024425 RepID=UPI0025BCE543|nr:universal stress protein [Hamadaea sp.]
MVNKPVVVGVDGSPESLGAAEAAAREAVLRRVPLDVVHGFIWPYMRTVPLGPSDLGPIQGGLENEARQLVDDAVARSRKAVPGAEITGRVVTGSAAQVLIAAAHEASLVVVGDRGLGAFTGLLAGSVAVHVAAHAACPVLVVRGDADPVAPVLLATDGSPSADPAVGFAFEEASLRGTALIALHAWRHPMSARPGDMQPLVYDEAVGREEEERVLAEALAGWREKFPDVVVRQQVTHGRIRRTIIDATAAAQLVVLGSRGHGGFTGLLLGSVSQAVLHHSACPVVIVPSAVRH